MKNLLSYLLIILSVGCNNPILKNIDNSFNVKSSNEAFQLELQLSNDLTDKNTPINFEVIVTRINPFPMYKLMGLWKLNSMEIDNVNQNISQFPTEMEFRNDNSYTISEENTITADLTYSGGIWNYNEEESTLMLTSMGQTQVINVSFDTESNFVALDGYMIWTYSDDTNSYKKVYQQTADYLNLESPSYIYLDSSGGFLTSTTHASTEIEIRVGFDIGDSYNIIGSFEPGLDFNKGNIVVSLENIDYSPMTISKEIIIENPNEE